MLIADAHKWEAAFFPVEQRTLVDEGVEPPLETPIALPVLARIDEDARVGAW